MAVVAAAFTAVLALKAHALIDGDVTVAAVTPYAPVDSNGCAAGAGAHAMYVEVTVSNNTPGTLTDLLATVSGFAASPAASADLPADLRLAPGESPDRRIAALDAGASAPLYWYVDYPCTLPPAAAASIAYSVNVRADDDAEDAVAGSGPLTLTTRSELSASAGGRVVGQTVATTGDTVTLTVDYAFGNPSASADALIQPAGNLSFDSACLRLSAVDITASTFTAGPLAAVADRLYFPSVSGGASNLLTADYTFADLCGTALPPFAPFADLKSGGREKYTGNFGDCTSSPCDGGNATGTPTPTPSATAVPPDTPAAAATDTPAPAAPATTTDTPAGAPATTDTPLPAATPTATPTLTGTLTAAPCAGGAADIVFAIDTSFSMKRQIRGVVPAVIGPLPEMLTAAGIDWRLAIVRFGTGHLGRGPDFPDVALDFTTDAAAFRNALDGLADRIYGPTESGTEAIDLALSSLALRPDAAHLFVLYTDENDDLPVSLVRGVRREPPRRWLASPRRPQFQSRLDATAADLIAVQAGLDLVVNPHCAPSTFQYGSPAATVLDTGGQLDRGATLAALTDAHQEQSLQGQLLSAGKCTAGSCTRGRLGAPCAADIDCGLRARAFNALAARKAALSAALFQSLLHDVLAAACPNR